jgi:cytidylate kinase, putative
VDKLIDERQREIALSNTHIIAEGRLSGWMIPEADLKIWLKASLECRVKRIFDRDQFADLDAAMQATQEREASEALRYQQYYDIDINSQNPYHLVLDTEMWTVEQLGIIVSSAIKTLQKPIILLPSSSSIHQSFRPSSDMVKLQTTRSGDVNRIWNIPSS